MNSKEILSSIIVINGDNWQAHLNDFDGCNVMVWLFDKQLSGKVENGTLIFEANGGIDTNDIIELRIFNEHKELYLIKVNNIFKGRIRIDEEGSSVDKVDVENILWGKVSENSEAISTLVDARGTKLTIPGDFTTNTQVKVVIRNYIGQNEIGMAGYVDARFVEFIKM
jgi:CRISPR-associated protein (TIGR03984 family)